MARIFPRMNDEADPLHWYLSYTKPRQENIAKFHLEQQGFETYLPLFKKLKKSERGPVAVFEPMFPRYLFFKPGRLGQSIAPVRNTKGVTTLVRFGVAPAVIGADLLQRIRQIEDDRNHASLLELSELKAGQTVRLQHTALQGVEGLIQGVSSKRVAVLLEILGSPVLVQLQHHQVALTEG